MQHQNKQRKSLNFIATRTLCNLKTSLMPCCFTPFLLKLKIRKKVKIVLFQISSDQYGKLLFYSITFWNPAHTTGFLLFFTTAILDDNEIANGQFLNKQMHCWEVSVLNITEETFVHFPRLPKLKVPILQSKLFRSTLPVEATYPYKSSTIN